MSQASQKRVLLLMVTLFLVLGAPSGPLTGMPEEKTENPLQVEPLKGFLHPDDERRWRAGITHKYAWQRYKTVLEIRDARLEGSAPILREALRDRKFWTRMRAAMALADFGVPPTREELQQVLHGVRSELVTNFFQRFQKKARPGELYIILLALKLLARKGV
ncbi:MAG: HEAT repeat domain-containing protein [Deltaproteobacteria bacterium]|nr:HEAT repeat domain-containing protein [Deltaproteobacteria bacterium]